MVAAFHGQCHDDRCAAIFIVDALSLSLSLSLSCLFLFLYFSFGMRRFLCDVEGRRHRVSFSFDTRRSASPWISWRRTRLRSLVDWFTAFWFALPSFGAFATDYAVCHESPELPGFYRVFTAVSSLQLEWPRLLPSFTGFCRTAQACVSKLPGFFPTEFSCLKWWWKKKVGRKAFDFHWPTDLNGILFFPRLGMSWPFFVFFGFGRLRHSSLSLRNVRPGTPFGWRQRAQRASLPSIFPIFTKLTPSFT